MSSPLSWTPGPPVAPAADSTELLRRIDQNMANLLWWTKILVGAVVILILVIGFA
jgi:hypothetical protein